MMKFTAITAQSQSAFTILEPGKHVFFLHNYSGDLTIDIATPDAEIFIYGIYIGRNTDHFTLHTTQHHRTGKNISDLLIKGVFFDDSKFLYEGLIQIDPGAQQSNAYQKNQNLLLSPNAFVDSRPFLEIKANDVRCTHGSTTGRLNQDQLMYLDMRGLSAADAEKVLVEGFVHDVFAKMQEIGCETKSIEEDLFALFLQK
ncbi:hypothetical protein A3B02_02630 [Candidatus Roizmanbacteria bacterium RIFCSPLOWO2_01_FULL_42_14]|uniref:SUF system FeS cluster assembly SufBD core domain-containing protein n=3 Tax=Candidatus Roizmaniibacteriota TaxID=1752723 RepID=A0A1F7K1Z5_9BACT|nr:MAG: hypothetical protein A3D08_00890 [Candidatus Roizmanbacteria bacterium RIFCSPHIGHO2_02_FULL_43_11]OGK52019.1 MAG: hypothetical protein A3B02_02630 [Candidatus Roizmanbacteria bacterium RIFCSPLOWO2_01_FULL_42_14]OGK61898.1 MAG: hypothetical protein A3I56_03055 [Candidatus Roizmanbacteria bacterium RIFCSPLOWO2_02_FULL_43_10]